MFKNFKYIGNFLLESQKNRKLVCKLDVSYSNDLYSFLNILRNENLIIGYRTNDLFRSCYIYLKYYKEKSAINFIKFYGYPTNKANIKKKTCYFYVNNNKGSVFIISTNKGLTTGKLAMSSNSGGLLVCKIN